MENKYQEKFGYPIERTKGKVRRAMHPWIQEFICPGALKFSKLWDTEQIAKNIVAPLLPTKESGI